MSAKDDSNQYLNSVDIAQGYVRVKSLLVNLEQMQAVKDLDVDTYFAPKGDDAPYDGPYDLVIRLDDEKLIIDVADKNGKKLEPISFALKPYKKLIQDYFLIVESYEQARLEGNVSRLEAIDMGRRGVHNEGAEVLQNRLSSAVTLNKSTSRRLFTLMCILCAGRSLVWF